MTKSQIKQCLQDSTHDAEATVHLLGVGTMWLLSNGHAEHVLLNQPIKGPGSQHEATLVRVDLTQRNSEEDDVKVELDQTTEEMP